MREMLISLLVALIPGLVQEAETRDFQTGDDRKKFVMEALDDLAKGFVKRFACPQETVAEALKAAHHAVDMTVTLFHHVDVFEADDLRKAQTRIVLGVASKADHEAAQADRNRKLVKLYAEG